MGALLRRRHPGQRLQCEPVAESRYLQHHHNKERQMVFRGKRMRSLRRNPTVDSPPARCTGRTIRPGWFFYDGVIIHSDTIYLLICFKSKGKFYIYIYEAWCGKYTENKEPLRNPFTIRTSLKSHKREKESHLTIDK